MRFYKVLCTYCKAPCDRVNPNVKATCFTCKMQQRLMRYEKYKAQGKYGSDYKYGGYRPLERK